MEDLRGFLDARLAEDEQVAVAVFRDHTWSAYREGGTDGWAVEGAHSGEPSCIVGDEAMASHIARYDPARVLAEVAAKRQIIALHEQRGGGERRFATVNGETTVVDLHWCARCNDVMPCQELRLLALSYADHPDYREEFKP